MIKYRSELYKVISEEGELNVYPDQNISSITLVNTGDEIVSLYKSNFTLATGESYILSNNGIDEAFRNDDIFVEFDGTGTNPQLTVLVDIYENY